MPRGNDQFTKVFYQGKVDDFVIFVDDVDTAKKWRNDRTIPLAQVVSGWKVFVTHKQGAQGILDGASKAVLENEFGTSRDEEVVEQILEKGEIQEATNPERSGRRNLSNGGNFVNTFQV
ncbi:putative RNA binding protein [Talaromyces proteolyticus]|uniref:RNA binding protein n=1 Tax=Talaromyces proteolyticus TaxID=1131652 RepID=A0AAD4KX46_9EURO|nr:putative RNA binding protein [Talaromyces proteolyticus]KAH8703151.1 putative RNA binding protein [Talaromyces proteolyticus]